MAKNHSQLFNSSVKTVNMFFLVKDVEAFKQKEGLVEVDVIGKDTLQDGYMVIAKISSKARDNFTPKKDDNIIGFERSQASMLFGK